MKTGYTVAHRLLYPFPLAPFTCFGAGAPSEAGDKKHKIYRHFMDMDPYMEAKDFSSCAVTGVIWHVVCCKVRRGGKP